MKSEFKYIWQGLTLVMLAVIVFSASRFLYSTHFIKPKKTLTTATEPDAVYTITQVTGQHLFSEKCAACHGLLKHAEPDLLQGFEERIPDKKLLYEWIRNSSKVIKSGNPYFNAMYKEYGVMMPDFPELTDQQISDILEYIRQAQHLKKAKNS